MTPCCPSLVSLRCSSLHSTRRRLSHAFKAAGVNQCNLVLLLSKRTRHAHAWRPLTSFHAASHCTVQFFVKGKVGSRACVVNSSALATTHNAAHHSMLPSSWLSCCRTFATAAASVTTRLQSSVPKDTLLCRYCMLLGIVRLKVPCTSLQPAEKRDVCGPRRDAVHAFQSRASHAQAAQHSHDLQIS